MKLSPRLSTWMVNGKDAIVKRIDARIAHSV